MKAMAVSKKKPYSQQDKWRSIENALSVKQRSKEKKDWKFSSAVIERHFL